MFPNVNPDDARLLQLQIIQKPQCTQSLSEVTSKGIPVFLNCRPYAADLPGLAPYSQLVKYVLYLLGTMYNFKRTCCHLMHCTRVSFMLIYIYQEVLKVSPPSVMRFNNGNVQIW